mmetsp:Transcript_14577/g.43527  ORF Transcript_14577/g.43527 Transcript_14577/m.43527 type:complete len:326 (-) Transcript_14577:82-1059(-)
MTAMVRAKVSYLSWVTAFVLTIFSDRRCSGRSWDSLVSPAASRNFTCIDGSSPSLVSAMLGPGDGLTGRPQGLGIQLPHPQKNWALDWLSAYSNSVSSKTRSRLEMASRALFLTLSLLANGARAADAWHKANVPSKDCAWVAEYVEGRCGFKHGTKGVKGEDGTFASEACDACKTPVTVVKPFYLSVPAGETKALVGLSAVYELAFEKYEANSFGTLTVYGAAAGAANKCEMAKQYTTTVSLSEDMVVSSTSLQDIPASPLFPGATKLIVPSMQYYPETNELGYLVVPQGVLPDYSLYPDYTGAAWRDAGKRFQLVDDITCPTAN